MELKATPTFKEIAQIEVSYRTKVKPSLRPVINKSEEAYEVLMAHWDSGKLELVEQFKIVLLNNANRAIGIYEASSGTSDGCVVDVRLVFACALKVNAKKIILCHNHPSGKLKPSESDINLTSKMVDAGKLLNIPVLDHLIITSEGYISFADKGLL